MNPFQGFRYHPNQISAEICPAYREGFVWATRSDTDEVLYVQAVNAFAELLKCFDPFQ